MQRLLQDGTVNDFMPTDCPRTSHDEVIQDNITRTPRTRNAWSEGTDNTRQHQPNPLGGSCNHVVASSILTLGFNQKAWSGERRARSTSHRKEEKAFVPTGRRTMPAQNLRSEPTLRAAERPLCR